MSKILNSARRILLVIVLLALFLLSWAVSTIPLFAIVERSYKQKVGISTPEMFPVLIIILGKGNKKHEAQIVYKKNLKDFIEKNREYTYLVPEGEEHYLNEVILQKCRFQTMNFNWESPDPWYARFKVEHLASDKQFLEVECTWDDDRVNVGWYEASDKVILPKYYKFYFGPGLVFRVLPIAYVATAIIWAIGFLVYKRLKKKKGLQ